MKMDKRYTKLLRTLNENKDGHHVHISVGLNHDIMAVHNSKEAGMKYMVMGDGPDGHFLVKTTRKALGKKRVGQFVGSRISRHLDKQPFPHDDGPHYSVHKESVERAKNVARGMGVNPDDVIRGMGKGPHAEKDKARAAKEPKETLKSRAKNVVRGMGINPDNVMRGMGFEESVLPSSIGTNWAPKEDRDRSDRVRDHELARLHHERQMTRDPENKKYHLQQASLHSAAEDAGAEISRIAPGELRDAAIKDFEEKSKKAHAGSVQHLGASVEVNEKAHTMVCKDCGDELNKPTTDCANDCSDPNGSHWVKEYSEATEYKVRARTLRRRDPALIALKRTEVAKNKNTRPGTEADLNKGRPKWDQHDWNDRDAYPKESTEVDELAQMVPNKSQLNKNQQQKRDKLDAELKAMRARMAEETQNEDYELTEEDLPEAWTPGMRRAAARRMKILAPRIKLGIKRSKNRTATKEKLMNRAIRKVKSDLIKKFTKGSSKTDLSPARRADMEKRIAKLGPRIKQLAQKQLPATRRMEADRKRNKNK
jgi:transcriptional regulator of met regulon